MKAILLSLSLLLTGAASAETITLGTATCGTLKQCINIPNDAALDLDLYGAPNYPFFYLYIDGVTFKSSIASGMGVDDALLTDANGNMAYITATFTSYKTCTRSGRGQTCLTHWSLIGGTLVR